MILLKILFLIFDLVLVIGLVIEMLKEESVCKKIGFTAIIMFLLLRWLYILVIWETKLIKIGGDNNANCKARKVRAKHY